jgi:hypothetical protein
MAEFLAPTVVEHHAAFEGFAEAIAGMAGVEYAFLHFVGREVSSPALCVEETGQVVEVLLK